MQDSMAIPSAPLQPTTTDPVLEANSNHIAMSPSATPTEPPRSPLTPADICTLKKTLDDVPTPSPPVSLGMHKDESMRSIVASEDGSSDSGIEDQLQYTEHRLAYGDELEQGYEDEDDSMELSDDGDESADQSILLDNGEREYVWSDGDTAEDIMNTPGKIAPPARPQHIDGIYQHDPPAPGDVKKIKLQRATIEEMVKQERLDQEYREAIAIGNEKVDDGIMLPGEDDYAIDLSDETEFQQVQNVQARIGLSIIEEGNEAEVDVQYFEPSSRRTSRRFSPAPISRRASEESLPVSSFRSLPDSRPAVVANSSGHHLAFTSNARIPDRPFTATLGYYKQYKGKENSPTKSRRNASLPEEIAELTREANEEEDLEKYREMDLAPMDSVIESNNAGDLITFGTPAKSNIITPSISLPTPTRLVQRTNSVTEHDTSSGMGLQSMTGTLREQVGAHNVVDGKTQISSSGSPSSHASTHSGKDHKDAGVADTEAASDPRDKEAPTFINVVAMLPEAIFWATAAPVAKYSTMAYEAMVAKFTNLEM